MNPSNWWPFKLKLKEPIMKAEILANIAALQQKRDALQQQLQMEMTSITNEIDAETAKLNKLLAEIPAEFHNMTQEVFDKLKEYFQ